MPAKVLAFNLSRWDDKRMKTGAQNTPNQRAPLQRMLDLVFLPVRLALDHKTVSRLGLTSVLDERIAVCVENSSGLALDVGAGEGNPFIARYGRGYGFDIIPQRGVNAVADALNLPFGDSCFDTVLFIGSYLYMPDRTAALKEAARVLTPGGRVLITHINPALYWLRHKTAWWDKKENVSYPKHEPLWNRTILGHISGAGLCLEKRLPYLAHLCTLYVARKPGRSPTGM
jgi:SAM-dependent methyltransferase